MEELEAAIASLRKQFEDAEDDLVTLGFPEDQWMLIKKYITGAIAHSQLLGHKAIIDNMPNVDTPLAPTD